MAFLKKIPNEGFLRKRLRLLKNEFFSNIGGFFKFLLTFGIMPFVIALILNEKGVFDRLDKETLEFFETFLSYTFIALFNLMDSIIPREDWGLLTIFLSIAIFVSVTLYTIKFTLIVIHDYIGTKFHKKEVCWHEEFDY